MNGSGRYKTDYPVKPLQDAFKKSNYSLSELARHLGWYDNTKPAASRVGRRLGLYPHSRGLIATQIRYSTAIELCRAMKLDPIDIGL